jgi:hypothetical protein
MRAGRPGWRGLIGVLAAVGGLLGLSSCGSDSATVAVGADVDRPSRSSMDLVGFENVASESGLEFRHGAFQFGTDPDPAAMMGGGVCWIDYDRDGWLDLFATNTWSNGEWGEWRKAGGLPRSQLFRNEAGSFVDVTDDVAVGLETRANGCVAADLDLDGWTDLYVTTERENVLLWNDGGDGFLADGDVSGVDEFGWHSGAAVGDVDGNGWPDLFVAGYTDLNRPIAGTSKGFPNTSEPEPDLLFLSDGPAESGDARIAFREVAADVGIEPDGADYGLGAVLSDLDGDGDLDLYVANDTTPNQLYENVASDDQLGFRFVEIGAEAGVDDSGAGMGVASGDGDGDGNPDLVVTNQLEERHGAWWNLDATAGLAFEDARDQMGFPDLGEGLTGWGVVWADVDLDSDLDLFFAHGAIPVRDLVADRERALLLENHTADGRVGEFGDASSRSDPSWRGVPRRPTTTMTATSIWPWGRSGATSCCCATPVREGTGSSWRHRPRPLERESRSRSTTARSCTARSTPAAATSRRRIRVPTSGSGRQSVWLRSSSTGPTGRAAGTTTSRRTGSCGSSRATANRRAAESGRPSLADEGR